MPRFLLSLLVLSSLLLHPATAQDSRNLEQRLRAVLQAEEFELVSVTVPDADSDEITVALPLQTGTQSLVLSRHSLRSELFEVRVDDGNGTRTLAAPPAPLTYRGQVLEAPSITVAASLGNGGITATAIQGSEVLWTIEPVSLHLPDVGVTPLHVVREENHDHWKGMACGTEFVQLEQPVHEPVESTDLGLSRGGCLEMCQIAFDADFEYYQARGSSVPNTVARIESHMNLVDLFYARDLLITYEITNILVRTAPFYSPTGGGDLLNLFRDEWNTNQAGVVRDIGHLMTGKPGSLIEFGGLAWVGVVCTNFGYGWSMDTANIVGHEVGHNWGSGHCHDTSPCNNMCGACLNIGPRTKAIKEAHRDSRTCLDPAPPYATQVPPYAQPDELDLRKDELAAATTLTLDLLANDQDGNCDPLTFAQFDATTVRGATVVLSPGTGSGGRDELIYTPPAELFVGTDVIHYTVSDGQGGLADGTFTLRVRPLELAAYYPLDESSGTVAAEASGRAASGETEGNPSWLLGQYGNALRFDGVDDSVAIDPLNLHTNEITISAWVRRNGQQSGFAGLVFSRDGNTVAGLHLGNSNALKYTWNDAPSTYNWGSGLVLPDNQWTFVALVVTASNATIYMDDGTLRSSTNNVAHALEEFDGELRLGVDPNGGNRFFDGRLDEVRIHDYALGPAEIADLATRGGAAQAPRPGDGSVLLDTVSELSWIAGLEADSHDVYFGTDHDAVAAATPASPEFVGNQIDTSFAPQMIVDGVEYFWRIDERVGAEVVPGPVWQFHLARFHHWELDETSGTTAADSRGSLDGTYQGTGLGQQAPNALLGTAVRFNGSSGAVEIPALDLSSNRVTMTAWIRRDGGSFTPGLIFSRDGSTVAGLHLDSNNRLAYHWNDDAATRDWDSGLNIPNQDWVFVGLVIEPHRATLYKGLDGNFRSEVNPVAHAHEEFDGRLFIGRDEGAANRYFRGWIDDVRIYDGALTPADVFKVYETSSCAQAGSVNRGAGAVVSVLFVNGEDRSAEPALGEPIEITFEAAPLTSDEPYILWIWQGETMNPLPLASGPSLFGCTVNPTPLHGSASPQPFRCIRGTGIPRAACRGVQEKPGPASVPWTLQINNGLGQPATFLLQGMVLDPEAQDSLLFSVTNAVILDVGS